MAIGFDFGEDDNIGSSYLLDIYHKRFSTINTTGMIYNIGQFSNYWLCLSGI
jgi:hypothetical protein